MATRYAFVDEADGLHSAVLVQDYGNSPDTALTETINESYMTANEEENETQYFSVLESSSGDLLNDTLSNKANSNDSNHLLMNDETEDNTVDIAGQQVVLFKVGESEELYGIQLAQDDEGNIQKYQFKIRHNEEGNLEAIPETIQILPFDSEVPIIDQQEEISTEESDEANTTIVNEQIFIKQEINTETLSEYCEEGSEQEDEQMNLYQENFSEYQEATLSNFAEEDNAIAFQDNANSDLELTNKDNFAFNSIGDRADCKQVLLDQVEEDPQDEDEIERNSKNLIKQALPSDEFSKQYGEDILQPNDNADDIETESYEQLFKGQTNIKNIKPEPIETTVDLDHIFADDENDMADEQDETDNIIVSGANDEDDSENEDYEIIDGLQVTDEDAESFEQFDTIPTNHITYRERVVPLHAHVLKLQTPQNQPKTLNFKNVKIRKVISASENRLKEGTLFVAKKQEKENLNEIARLKDSLTKTANPRSLLKTSQATPIVDVNEVGSDEKFEKRFAKSKEAIQARQFHNFIAQTKIIHAPVRSQRLPRKQKISPVSRMDEEIIVQEVVISSNGFVETSEDGVLLKREPLKPTEYIQLSDSDDDYDPKKVVKSRKKGKKRRSIITISDTEEEDESDYETVNVDSDGNEKNNKSPEDGKDKRKRGRPPKPKVSELKLDELYLDKKLEIQCEKCTKTFPSQGSLKTHMQFHTIKEANKRKIAMTNSKPVEYKHKCSECNETFKNNLLLTRHMTVHKRSMCLICKKVFASNNELAIHKRTHAKQQMVLSTATVTVSPMKMKTRASVARKANTPPKAKSFICSNCKRVFDSKITLELHAAKHRRFTCNTCSASFLSKILLDTHVRDKCVKSPKRNRLTNIPRRSVLPTKVCTRRSAIPANVVVKERLVKLPVAPSIKCEQCPSTFTTHSNLLKHRVVTHGHETPDKSVGKGLRKSSGNMHGGIPASEKFKNAFAALKRKLEN